MSYYYIYNPSAGNEAFKHNLPEFKNFLIDNNIMGEFIRSTSLDYITDCLKQATKKDYEAIVVIGGDGTVHAAVQALAGEKTPLALLPTGRENLFATSQGITDNFNDLLSLLKKNNKKAFDVAQVDDKRYFITSLNLGWNAIKTEKVGMRGMLKKILKQDPFAINPFPIVAQLGQKEISVPSGILSVVSTSWHFKDRFQGKPNPFDGSLDLFIFSDLDKKKNLNKLRQSTIIELNESNLSYFKIRTVTIKKHPFNFIEIDGEKIETDESFTVSMSKKKLKLLVP